MPLPDPVTTVATTLGVAVDLGTFAAGVRALQHARAERTAEHVLEAADMTPEDLARKVRDHETLGDLLAVAVEIGSRTRSEQKRRALGAIVGRALVHSDTAHINETELLLKAIEPLEAGHIAALTLLHVTAPDEVDADQRGDLEQRSLSEADVVARTSSTPPAISAVMAILTSLGLAEGVIKDSGTWGGGGLSTADRWTIAPFGRVMLRWLTLEEGESLHVDD